MLVHPHDAATPDECRALLLGHDFGQLVAPGRGRAWPVVVPTHFAFDGASTILTHFARPNPVWAALEEDARAMFLLVADYVYVKTDWNAEADEDPAYGVPTSYYAAVQCECDVELVDDPEGLAALLRAQLARMQPEGGHARVEAGDDAYARQFRGIRGVRLHVRTMRGKMKYGGNRTPAHRERVAAHLAARDGPMDAAAREHLLRRLPGAGGPLK